MLVSQGGFPHPLRAENASSPPLFNRTVKGWLNSMTKKRKKIFLIDGGFAAGRIDSRTCPNPRTGHGAA